MTVKDEGWRLGVNISDEGLGDGLMIGRLEGETLEGEIHIF